MFLQGRSQDFQRGGGSHCVKVRVLTRSFKGGVTLCQSDGLTHLHGVFATCCRLFASKRLTKGGSRAPQDPPWLRPCSYYMDARMKSVNRFPSRFLKLINSNVFRKKKHDKFSFSRQQTKQKMQTATGVKKPAKIIFASFKISKRIS